MSAFYIEYIMSPVRGGRDAGWSSWQLVGLITRRSGVQIPPPQPHGSIAQLARAFGSYPECHRFESYLSHIRRQTLQGSVFLCFRLKRTRPMTRRDPGDSRRGLPVAEISSAAVSTETSDLSGGQSRRLRLRNRSSNLRVGIPAIEKETQNRPSPVSPVE